MTQIWQPLDPSTVCPAHSSLTACSAFSFMYLSLLVKLYGGPLDKIEQDEVEQDVDEIEEYDFIIVGAGSAGSVVANRLSAVEKWKILLLEAGPEEPKVTLVPGLTNVLLGSNIDWNYYTQPDERSCLAFKNGCSWPRGKVMGGSSSINTMTYVRGNKLDFDSWAAMGNEGWSYKDVLPLFKKQENNLNTEKHDKKYHGSNGHQHISRFPYIDDPSYMLTEAWNETGLPIRDFNAEEQYGTQQGQAFSLHGLRDSAYTAFIRPIRHERKNLLIKTDAEVVKILIDKKKSAYGVEYVKNGKIYTATAYNEVIISGGVINTPKLLMLSGVGPKNHLEKLKINVIKNLAVGENLHDHVSFHGIVIRLPKKTSTVIPKYDIINQIIEFKKEDKHNGPLSGNGPNTGTVAFLKTDLKLPAPDVQVQLEAIYADEYIKEPAFYDEIRNQPTPYYDGMLVKTINLVPKSRGRILLNETDPFDSPIIYGNYYKDPSDLKNIIAVTKYMIALENTEAFRSRGAHYDKTPLKPCKKYRWGTNPYVECLARHFTISSHHPVGTCKMGPHLDRKAVVDARLRVYGITNLRVIDSSIMPVVTRGNTNAPSLMIGEKGAEMILEEWLEE